MRERREEEEKQEKQKEKETETSMSSATKETPLVSFVEPGTATNDRHNRTAGDVRAVTMLSGEVLPPGLDASYRAVNFDLQGSTCTLGEALADMSRTHSSYKALATVLEASAAGTQQSTVSVTRSLSDAISYDELLQSLMCEGEAVACGFMLGFSSITMQARRTVTDPYVEIDRPLFNGRLALTNGRLLALSSQPAKVGTLTRHGVKNPKTNIAMKNTITYEVKYEMSDNVHFRPYPLASIKSFDFHLASSTEASVQVQGPTPCCCCCCCGKKWSAAPRPPLASTTRQIVLYLTNGPFENSPGVALNISVNADEPVGKIKQFLVELQKIAPNLGLRNFNSLGSTKASMKR